MKKPLTILIILLNLLIIDGGYYWYSNKYTNQRLTPEVLATKPKNEPSQGCKWDYYTGPMSDISLWIQKCKNRGYSIKENPNVGAGAIAFYFKNSNEYLDIISYGTKEIDESPEQFLSEEILNHTISNEFKNKCYIEKVEEYENYKIPEHKSRYVIMASDEDLEKWYENYDFETDEGPCGPFGEGSYEMSKYFEFDDRVPYGYIFVSYAIGEDEDFDLNTISF